MNLKYINKAVNELKAHKQTWILVNPFPFWDHH